jgi:hypothetical protein
VGDLVKIRSDHREHAFRIVKNLVVPEPQDAVPLAFQKPSAPRLMLRREVTDTLANCRSDLTMSHYFLLPKEKEMRWFRYYAKLAMAPDVG